MRPLPIVRVSVALCSLIACRQILDIDDLSENSPPNDVTVSSTFTVANRVAGGETLTGIWGSDDFVVTVGTSGVSYFYDHDRFERVGGNAKGRDFAAVSGHSKSDIYTAGTSTSGGFVSHSDGHEWRVIYETDTPLHGVWCVPNAHGAVIVVGDRGTILGYDATRKTWSKFATMPKAKGEENVPNAPILWSISGQSIDDFSIAGSGQTYHWEPALEGFANYRVINYGGVSFRAVWQLRGPASNALFGTNYSGAMWFSGAGGSDHDASADAGVTYRFNEFGRDETEEGAANRFTTGVWGTAEKFITVDDHGRIRTHDLGTLATKRLPAPTDEPLNGIWGKSLDDIWIVGSSELILRGTIR